MLLNSILLEGSLHDVPVFTPAVSDDTFDQCTFNLDCGPSASSIPVVAQNRLALRCRELLDRSSEVRVVGRVIRDVEASARTEAFALAVLIEHIEVRPALRSHAEVD